MKEHHLPTHDPFTTLAQMAGGYCVARSLHVIARLRVADLLNEKPVHIQEISRQCGTNTDALHRILKLLAANGVFEVDNYLVSHSEASRLLRSDHPHSMQAFAQMFGLSVNWNIYEHLEYTVRTGRPAAEKVIPEGLWQYYGTHPEENKVFNAAMASKAHAQVYGILKSFDFTAFKCVADIAGGRGHLISAILEASSNTKGILFDLPHVITEVQAIASPRLTLQPGDFFKDKLPSCDAYLLMEIIHDWADQEAIAILNAIHKVAPPGASLLVIEQIMPETPGPHWSKTLDIHMLTLLGGRQRTLKEYEVLLSNSGFALKREIDTLTGTSIIEAVKV